MAILFALALPAMLGALALCVDVGMMYLNWEELQKAADAAVLAGANRGLPYDAALATRTAEQYAVMNGVPQNEIVSINVAPDDMSIAMTLRRDVPYTFGRVLGLASAPVTVSATAGIQSAQAACGFLPIGVPCNASAPVSSVSQCSGSGYNTVENGGSMVQLKPFPNGQMSMQGPGNWEPLALGGAGGQQYENNIIYGYSGPALTPGATVNTETGQIVGPTFQGFQQRLENGGQTSFISAPPEDTSIDAANPQLVLVPLVNFASPSGKSGAEIVGFQEMWVSNVDGRTATISGYFVNQVPGCSIPQAAGQNPISEYSAVLVQ
jgi:hypothetical protein